MPLLGCLFLKKKCYKKVLVTNLLIALFKIAKHWINNVHQRVNGLQIVFYLYDGIELHNEKKQTLDYGTLQK